jgi:hypothetical protein
MILVRKHRQPGENAVLHGVKTHRLIVAVPYSWHSLIATDGNLVGKGFYFNGSHHLSPL